MAYWTLTTDCLVLLRENWIKYYNERLDALDYLCKTSEQDYRNEGNDDLRYERYNARSVQEWYDDKVEKLYTWAKESIRELEEENRKFERLFKQACEDFYTSNDYGYIIIYDFYKFERRREIDPTVEKGKFRVRFSGQTHWYSSCGRRRDLEFKTGKPYFDRHD